MAQINIEEIIEHLSTDMKSALNAAVDEVASGANIDRPQLYRAFVRAVRRKCNTWEQVPDSFVRT